MMGVCCPVLSASDNWSLAINLATLVVLLFTGIAVGSGAYFSRQAAHAAAKASDCAEGTLKTNVRPVLVFERRLPEEGPSPPTLLWQVRNIGWGPAIDIKIRLDEDEEDILGMYELACREKRFLAIVEAVKLTVTYHDVLTNAFTTTCSGNQNRVELGNRHAHWVVKRHEHDWQGDVQRMLQSPASPSSAP